MKRKFTNSAFTLALILAVGSSVSVFAQDTRNDNHTVTVVIPAVALLDLESTGTKNFTSTFTAPTEAGDKLLAPADNAATWLNYSSVQTSEVTKRVDVKASPLVSGVDIHLVAANAVNTVGAKGTPIAAGITLTTADQPLINTIGSAYTLTGASNGHMLTYGFSTVTDDTKYADLRSGSQIVTVTYTLADN